MKYLLTIKANNSPELLERLLRITRHRGFTVQNINGQTTDNGKLLEVMLTVHSERPISQLSKQLEKLFGVIKVSISDREQAIKATA